MDRGEQHTRRRDLDRRLLALASEYESLGQRVAGETVDVPAVNPVGCDPDALFGMAADLRTVAGKWAPETRAFAAVYAVVRDELPPVWWTTADADAWMRAQGLGRPYAVKARAVGYPNVNVELHERVEEWLACGGGGDGELGGELA